MWKRFPFLIGLSFLITLLFSLPTHSAENIRKGLSPEVAADYVYAVLSADRAIYSEFVVDRLKKDISLQATENWRRDKTLILPAQFMLLASKILKEKESALKYRLISRWPINSDNGPQSKREKNGLALMGEENKAPSTWIENLNGVKTYNAIYPDIAVTQNCASCHNAHPKSPKKDFKKGDIMGGIHISFPLTGSGPDASLKVPPEVVADYVHSILDADRTVYTQYVVNHLQKKKVLHATENWQEEKALLLPAQFLLNASRYIRKNSTGLDFKLISLWPISSHNGPANSFERTGLETVAKQPLRPYVGTTSVGDKKFFQAVYPDLAVSPSCVNCHNEHPKSPRQDFQMFDVLGGVVVSLPAD